MAWYPRNCTWCGVPLAARTADPDVNVVCMTCDPSPDIPLEPDGSDVTGQRGEAERIDAKYEQDIRAAASDPYALCMRAYYAADPVQRADWRTRWVMDLACYKRIRAVAEAYLDSEEQTDPETWVPDPGDRLCAMLIDVRENGGEPHLETPDVLVPR